MTSYPGDLTPAEQDEWAERFNRLAVEKWGEERAQAISGALRRLAIAIGRVERLQFSHVDAPAFYLENMPQKPEEGRPQ